MIHFLKLIAVIVAISYSLRLINAQSDLLVFTGLGVAGLSVYYAFYEFNKFLNNLTSRS